MRKLICFFRLREHYKQRLKQRGGKHWWFLKAKKVCERQSYTKGICEEWRYKNFVWLTQNYKLQTFINKDIKTGKWKRRFERQQRFRLLLAKNP